MVKFDKHAFVLSVKEQHDLLYQLQLHRLTFQIWSTWKNTKLYSLCVLIGNVLLSRNLTWDLPKLRASLQHWYLQPRANPNILDDIWRLLVSVRPEVRDWVFERLSKYEEAEPWPKFTFPSPLSAAEAHQHIKDTIRRRVAQHLITRFRNKEPKVWTLALGIATSLRLKNKPWSQHVFQQSMQGITPEMNKESRAYILDAYFWVLEGDFHSLGRPDDSV